MHFSRARKPSANEPPHSTTACKDERAKEFMRSSVFSSLDDVDQFLLSEPKTRPSMEMWEPMWLDGADRILTIAEQSFAKFEEQVKQFGGPENVRMYG